MSDRKTSWDYQKLKNYKQVKLVFNLDDIDDALIYQHLQTFKPNRTSYIKKLVYEDMVRWSDEK